MNKDIVVVDANIAVKWAVMEEDSHIAERLLTEWNLQSTRIIVPALFLYEISNILWKKVRRDVLAFSRAKQAMKFILDTGIETYCSVDKEVNLRALDLANTYNLPATYDAHYLALAERENCEFWTADERLYNSVRDRLFWVRLMADPLSASMAS
jgi:predicted nucleic acid-binding protein